MREGAAFCWIALLLAALPAACRARTPARPAVDWSPGPGAARETAALLLLDQDGMAKLTCLPGRAPAPHDLPKVALQSFLDVGWRGEPVVAGAAAADGTDEAAAGELVLLAPGTAPRRLATGVRAARFSPDARALAYEVARPGEGGGGLGSTSYVLDLATNELMVLGALTDLRWEADGEHLRATRLRAADAQPEPAARGWASLRVRWNRTSRVTTADGPGSAQIPAPAGEGIAWSGTPPSRIGPDSCAVVLSRHGGVRHSIVGPFCMGIADDRGVRWSPDGRWLAFPHPPVSRRRQSGGFFVDVVGIEGGRSPALSALRAKVRPEQLAIATAPASFWLDWSPSGRWLAVQDGASDLYVYDFEAQGIAGLGKGRRPLWSPGGAYLFLLSADRSDAEDAGPRLGSSGLVLSGVAPAARIDLGMVRDARWLPAPACAGPAVSRRRLQ